MRCFTNVQKPVYMFILQHPSFQRPLLRLAFLYPYSFDKGRFDKGNLVHCSVTLKGFSYDVLKSNCTNSVQL